MIKRSLILTISLLCCLNLMAQTDGVWTFSGKVVDAKTQKALSHVSVTHRNVGTVTNEEGEFTLKLKETPATVTFSCLGYKSQHLSAADCKAHEIEGKPVAMQASSVVLSEIVVKGIDKPRQLVEEAIEKIDVNYPQQPNLLRGFYRETTQKRNRFISVAEGVVDVYKSPYYKMDGRDGVAILKGRRLLSQRKNDTLAVKLQGGPVLPVHLDIVKERDILLNLDELNYYHFSSKGMKTMGDRMAYVIEIKPAIVVEYPLYQGNLYIDKETLAFTKIELELDMSNTEKATQSILRKKPLGLRFTPHELTIDIDYKTDNGVTRINYIRNVIRFRCDWKRKLFKSNFTVVSEMVVTDRREGEDVKPIKVRDTFNRRDNFYDKVIYFEDPDFWGDKNIIEPTEDLLQGIEKIKQKLK